MEPVGAQSDVVGLYQEDQADPALDLKEATVISGFSACQHDHLLAEGDDGMEERPQGPQSASEESSISVDETGAQISLDEAQSSFSAGGSGGGALDIAAQRRLILEAGVRPKQKRVCHVCGRECPSKHKLKRHLSTHSEERPFSCQLCGRNFKWTEYLAKHMRTQHAVNQPAQEGSVKSEGTGTHTQLVMESKENANIGTEMGETVSGQLMAQAPPQQPQIEPPAMAPMEASENPGPPSLLDDESGHLHLNNSMGFQDDMNPMANTIPLQDVLVHTSSVPEPSAQLSNAPVVAAPQQAQVQQAMAQQSASEIFVQFGVPLETGQNNNFSSNQFYSTAAAVNPQMVEGGTVPYANSVPTTPSFMQPTTSISTLDLLNLQSASVSSFNSPTGGSLMAAAAAAAAAASYPPTASDGGDLQASFTSFPAAQVSQPVMSFNQPVMSLNPSAPAMVVAQPGATAPQEGGGMQQQVHNLHVQHIQSLEDQQHQGSSLLQMPSLQQPQQQQPPPPPQPQSQTSQQQQQQKEEDSLERPAKRARKEKVDIGIQCEVGPETLSALRQEESRGMYSQPVDAEGGKVLMEGFGNEGSFDATNNSVGNKDEKVIHKFPCEETDCKKAYVHRKDLIRHMRIRHGISPKNIQPIAMEAPEKPHVCPIESCRKSYFHLKDLRRHQRQCHMVSVSPMDSSQSPDSPDEKGSLRFPCDVPGCLRSYVHKKDLVRHKRIFHKDLTVHPSIPSPVHFTESDLKRIRHEAKVDMDTSHSRLDSTGSTASTTSGDAGGGGGGVADTSITSLNTSTIMESFTGGVGEASGSFSIPEASQQVAVSSSNGNHLVVSTTAEVVMPSAVVSESVPSAVAEFIASSTTGNENDAGSPQVDSSLGGEPSSTTAVVSDSNAVTSQQNVFPAFVANAFSSSANGSQAFEYQDTTGVPQDSSTPNRGGEEDGGGGEGGLGEGGTGEEGETSSQLDPATVAALNVLASTHQLHSVINQLL